jgi:hypothetical protein
MSSAKVRASMAPTSSDVERRHDKVRIALAVRLARELLGFRHHPPRAVPAVVRLIRAHRKDARGLARRGAGDRGGGEFLGNQREEARILREPKHEVDGVGFRLRHQCVPTKPTIRAERDPHRGPRRTNLSDDALHFFQAPSLASASAVRRRARRRCLPAKM